MSLIINGKTVFIEAVVHDLRRIVLPAIREVPLHRVIWDWFDDSMPIDSQLRRCTYAIRSGEIFMFEDPAEVHEVRVLVSSSVSGEEYWSPREVYSAIMNKEISRFSCTWPQDLITAQRLAKVLSAEIPTILPQVPIQDNGRVWSATLTAPFHGHVGAFHVDKNTRAPGYDLLQSLVTTGTCRGWRVF